jgi:hypothetical protein
MAVKTWTIIDKATRTHIDELVIQPADGAKSLRGCSVTQRTLRGGLSEGVSSLRVNNGRLSFDLLPTRGMGIWKAWVDGQEIGWRSPVSGPVHPQFVPFQEPSGLGWLEGFDELLVRCGIESNGAPDFDEKGRVTYPLHGRIANRPAHHVEVQLDDATGEIKVVGEVDEIRFLFQKLRLRTTVTTRAGSADLSIRDEIINLSDVPADAQILYHVNFGVPVLDAGARFMAPVEVMMPRDKRAAEGMASWDSYAAEEPGYSEQVYFLKLRGDSRNQSMALLRNAHGTLGVSLHFDVKQLPCFSLWKNTSALADGYVTGLEPGTNYPNPRSYEKSQDRVVKLAPKASCTFDLRMSVHPDAQSVAAAEAEVQKLQAGGPAKIHDQPQAGWCKPKEKEEAKP